MGLRFIAGGSGSGRSTFMYEKVIEEAIETPDMTFIVIVPEQCTMQTQKLLVKLHPKHGIMNIEVLSFERLAFRVFDELGTDTLSVLGETGKILVLRRLATELKGDLPILGQSLKKPGFLSEMKSLISELSQYHISPEEFIEKTEKSNLSNYEKKKVDEMSRLYRAFLDFIEKSFITSEQVLELLCDIVDRSLIVKDAVMIFDGFTGFTPLQNELVIKFMNMCRDIWVSITIDPAIPMLSDVRDEELFAMSKKMAKKLINMARMTRTDTEDTVFLAMDAKSRFPSECELKHLESVIFRTNTPYTGDGGQIRIAELTDPRRELKYAFATIRHIVREEGMQYKDFAIISADAKAYFDYADDIAKEYDIPCFKDEKTQIRFEPFIEFIEGALLVAAENASTRSMIHFLKSRFTGLTIDEVDMFELYLDESGMRGFDAYKRTLTVRPSDITTDELSMLDDIRKRIESLLTPFIDVAARNDSSVKEIAIALYKLIESCEAYDEKVYDLAMDVIDKMVDLVGDETVGADGFYELFAAGIKTSKLGRIPASNDSVIIGDLIRTRLDDIKVLFLLGVNDGVIPKEISRGGLLTQTDRQRLKDVELELAPSDREQAFAQRFYLYLALSKPSWKLFMTYSLLDNAGCARAPSYLIRTVKSIFPYIKVESDVGKLWMESEKAAVERLVLGLHGDGVYADNDAKIAGIIKYLNENDNDRLHRIIDAGDLRFAPDPIRKATMLAINGGEIRGSVSRLEQYASCSYKYFLQYILKLREHTKRSLEAVDLGTLYHDALYEYERTVQEKNIAWSELTDDESNNILENSLKVAYEKLAKPQALSEARERHILLRAAGTLRRTVWALRNQITNSSFMPRHFEVELSELSAGESVKMELSDDVFMKLAGRIDRIDEYTDGDTVYLKIIDYKSADKKIDLNDVYEGRQLQLLYYLKASIDAKEKSDPFVTIRPGAVLYYRVSDVYVDADWELDDIKLDEKVLKEFAPDGLYGDIMKSKNEISSRKSTVSDEDFRLYTDYAADKMRNLGNKIADGDVAPNPVKKDDRSPCEYCDYASVCGFDDTIPGFGYRYSIKYSEDELKEKMRESLAEDDNGGKTEVD